MKLVHKRILILFSIALNIGFIAMAVYHAQQRSVPKNERRWQELMGIVQDLDVSGDLKTELRESMARFRKEMDGLEKEVQQARKETMDLLAKPDPIDRVQLHALFEAEKILAQKKMALFEAHALEIRQVLGDENAAQFFVHLREHIKSKKNHSHG